ncbi:MAG: pentapeptide repeat-containing protein [Thermodesulfobacteriota bacterium]
MNRLRLSTSLLSCLLLIIPVQLAAGQEKAALIKKNLETLLNTKSCPRCNLQGVNLNRVDLTGANLEGADLRQAKLFLANLAKANLRNANLREATFGGADLGGADLRGADLRRTKFAGAYLKGTMFDGEFIYSQLKTSEGMPVIKEKVFVQDAVRPKQLPERQDVKIQGRRDFEEAPPVLPSGTAADESAQEVVKLIPVDQAPAVSENNRQDPVLRTGPVRGQSSPVKSASQGSKKVGSADGGSSIKLQKITADSGSAGSVENDLSPQKKQFNVKKAGQISAVKLPAPAAQPVRATKKSTLDIKDPVTVSQSIEKQQDSSEIVEIQKSYKAVPGAVDEKVPTDSIPVFKSRPVKKKTLTINLPLRQQKAVA